MFSGQVLFTTGVIQLGLNLNFFTLIPKVEKAEFIEHYHPKGRQIRDCIFFASECVSILCRKYFERNMALKLDIRKVFDTLRWDFLIIVLRSFEFSVLFYGLILNILQSAKISILLNGSSINFFSWSYEVR